MRERVRPLPSVCNGIDSPVDGDGKQRIVPFDAFLDIFLGRMVWRTHDELSSYAVRCGLGNAMVQRMLVDPMSTVCDAAIAAAVGADGAVDVVDVSAVENTASTGAVSAAVAAAMIAKEDDQDLH